jgi:hypothetical protein
VALVSRSGDVSNKNQGLEERLRWLQQESGAEVRVMKCDVSDAAAVSSMLSELRGSGVGAIAVEGVVHAAGLLRDAMIRGGGAAVGSAEVWAAKATSAWNLHEQTKSDALRLFVCYSSIVSRIGNMGQSAYGAANRYLDSLVAHRQSEGCGGVSVSIQWPAIRGVGMAAAAASAGHMSLDGWSIGVEDCERVLDDLLSGKRAEAMKKEIEKKIKSTEREIEDLKKKMELLEQ